MFGKMPDGSSSLKEQLKDLYKELENGKAESAPTEEMALRQKSASDKAYADKVASDQLAMNKAAVEMERLNAAKIISDRFFNLMMEALHKKGHFESNLAEAAERVGFSQLPVALNKVINSDGQSPLQYMIQKQNFTGAQALMDAGAKIGTIERAVLDIASDSKAGREFGLSVPTASEKLHPVKYFGLVLGIEMTSQDGTTSQYGHIAPTYQLMTDAVTNHAQSNPGNQSFKEIADAFHFSNKSAAFSNSTPQRNPEAGAEMSARIQSGKLTTIPVSCDGHAMGLSIVPDGPGSKSGYLVYTNRGLGADPSEYGTQIYRVDDLNKVNPKFINNMMNGFHNGTSHDEIKNQIAQVTNGEKPIHSIQQKGQKVDNCTIANSSSNVHGILLCQQAAKKGGFDKIDKADINIARDEYKKFKANMKADKVNELVNAITKNPNDSDLITLGKGFLNKKNVDPSLKTQMEKALGPHLEKDVKGEYQQRTELRG
ncbi:Dot/Icm T4SS effector AnkD/LegA15 [uncultured Legionella sp.]|uniref:Dot/Icm T4SS effector AnkD/LegA15 n=1 Tax=uncultured Legionella sp. TaxID=210934 RepID=UPI00262AE0B1|nr:Dot/Icm T4SS effector AnkD/LegA15 [uncultured Legionella sp.]